MGVQYLLDQGDAPIDEATLRSVHLPSYQAAVDAGAATVMVSFSSWNGVKMHANRDLLTGVLRDELGFEGFVVSDWQGIDQIPGEYTSDVATAINAGVDMVMVPYDYKLFIDTLTKAVERGDCVTGAHRRGCRPHPARQVPAGAVRRRSHAARRAAGGGRLGGAPRAGS